VSWQATAWVSCVEAGGPSGKLLLYALANYADENGRCWPSDQRLMSDTELSERAVRDWKRKLEEAGLIVVERRRTSGGTFQADEIRLSMGDEPPAKSAGGSTGKSCRDHRQMAPEPPANGAVPPAPPYKAEPSEEPPLEPEREGARADENSDDPAKFEKRVKKIAADHDWPGWANSSTHWTVAQFAKLTDGERAEAERLAGAYRAMTGRKALSLGTYFAERKWADVPDPAEAPPEPLNAPPFGPLWGSVRARRLLAPAEPSPAPTSAFIAQLIAQDDAAGRAERMRRQVQFGWPAVNRMHEAAEQRRGVTVTPELGCLAGLTEFVPVGTEAWEAWRLEHELRGWPWLPDPGGMGGAYFPKGGPRGLAEFEAAMKAGKGGEDDGGRSQAA
jgi:hypothetical protein